MGYADIVAATASQDALQRLQRLDSALSCEGAQRNTRIISRNPLVRGLEGGYGINNRDERHYTEKVPPLDSRERVNSRVERGVHVGGVRGASRVGLNLRNTFDTREAAHPYNPVPHLAASHISLPMCRAGDGMKQEWVWWVLTLNGCERVWTRPLRQG